MQRYSPFRLSAIFLLAVFLARYRPSAQLAEQEVISVRGVGSVRLASPGPLVLTNLLWFTAIDQVGPRARSCCLRNLQPFLAAIIALVLLFEELGRCCR